MGGQATALGTQRSLPGTGVSFACTVGASSGVALDLPTDRRWRAPQAHGNPAHRLARGNPPRDLLALLQPQRSRGPPPHRWRDPATERQNALNTALVPALKSSGNVGNALTGPPALPQFGLLLRREPDPCNFHHTHLLSGKIRRCCTDRLRPPSKAVIRECPLSARSGRSQPKEFGHFGKQEPRRSGV